MYTISLLSKNTSQIVNQIINILFIYNKGTILLSLVLFRFINR